MQLGETSHDREVGFRNRARQVVDASAADIQRRGLPGDRKVVLAVDCRFAFSRPALLSGPSKKLSRRCSPRVGIETGDR
jgi:hypothetical protein